ncbi:MAG TPA: DUF1579 domain-containing protein [Thermoanaerobaculia bacterium]|nr:DUF1579 domain-containing protein [Thermoanaerobaculia bacterium]
MKLKVFLAGALLVTCSTVAMAQHDHGHAPSAQQAPGMDAMMEAMAKAGTPGEAHKKLDAMVGTWNASITMWMAPGMEPMKNTGVSENRWVFGGRYLEQRFKGEFFGAPFEGVGYTGYDNVKKQYWGTWMDSMSTAPMNSTGSLSADGKTYSFTATMADPMTGKDSTSDEKITIIDADHHTLEMWGPGPDGKNYKMMEIAYSRKK